MTKRSRALFLVIGFAVISACEGIDWRGERDQSPQAVANRRSEIMERLAPEDGVGPSRLRAEIDAILTVRPDIDRRELPENMNAVRRILNQLSLQDLQRIERILPEIEKKRRLEGAD